MARITALTWGPGAKVQTSPTKLSPLPGDHNRAAASRSKQKTAVLPFLVNEICQR